VTAEPSPIHPNPIVPDRRLHVDLALALPQVVRARPTGLERADAIEIRIPIERANHDLTALGRMTSLAHMTRGTGEAERMPEGRFLMTRTQTRRVEVVIPGSDPAASKSVRPGRTLVDVAAVSATVPAGVDSREA
jgi:hypothetical protein